MKYILFFALSMMIFVSGCVIMSAHRGNDDSGITSDDVYEGTGQGYRGPVSVQVRMNDGNINEIIIVDSAEDHFIGSAAMEELIEIVVENNSTDVDAVSGATQTSRGFLEAVQNAILKL
ncbi:MAG: FMN-binding protein [Treponema sp.]|nr:FMN-binding protein [Treponema sp.]